MIKLREIKERDIEDIAKLLNNENVTKYLTARIPFPYGIEDAKWWVTIGSKEGTNRAIEFKGKFVGVVGITPGMFEKERSAEIGYWLGEKYWGRGIGTEAVSQLTDFIFNTTNIVRIFAPVFSPNTASTRLLEKCGYSLESTQKDAFFKQGQFYDAYVYVKIQS